MTFSLNIGAAVKTSLDAARTRLFDLIKGIENDQGRVSSSVERSGRHQLNWTRR